MVLKTLGDRFKKLFSSDDAIGQEQRSASESRKDRAETVYELQQHVHQLQGAIADLSRPGPTGAEPKIDGKKLAALQDELNTTQRTLARFQGRI